jgi:hypothetical protein
MLQHLIQKSRKKYAATREMLHLNHDLTHVGPEAVGKIVLSHWLLNIHQDVKMDLLEWVTFKGFSSYNFWITLTIHTPDLELTQRCATYSIKPVAQQLRGTGKRPSHPASKSCGQWQT